MYTSDIYKDATYRVGIFYTIQLVYYYHQPYFSPLPQKKHDIYIYIYIVLKTMLFTFKAYCLLLLINSTWKSGKIHRKTFLNFFVVGGGVGEK